MVTHLNHSKSGHTQLARDVFTHNELERIFRNPRVHTSRGRHVGNQQHDDEWSDEYDSYESDSTEEDETSDSDSYSDSESDTYSDSSDSDSDSDSDF